MADANSNTRIGSHVVDVANSINYYSDGFGQLAVLLKIIKEDLSEHSDARKLAELAYYLANDCENVADCDAADILKNGVTGFVGKDKKNLVTVISDEVQS